MSYNSETGLYEGYIYCIENLINQKRYIGQTTKTVSERWAEHKWDAFNRPSASKYLYRALAKYGVDNFRVSTIEKHAYPTKHELADVLNRREIYYISTYGCCSPSGYNLTIGGDNAAMSNLVPVFQFDMDGNFIDQYESLTEAERITGVSHTRISNVITHRVGRKSAGGFLWSKDPEPPVYSPDMSRSKRKPVNQLSMDGEVINTYSSIIEAADKLGLQVTLISACCNGRRKSTGGYRWTFSI